MFTSSRRCEVVYVGLGANLGRRARNLAQALVRLALLDGLELLRISPVYETAPWGMPDQPAFLNLAATARTCLSPHDLLRHAKAFESALGRKPGERWGPRAVDIDILLMGRRRLDTQDLTIPHPRMAQRQFVLVPLADIAPDVEVASGVTASTIARPDAPGLLCLGHLGEVVRREASET